MLRRLTKFVQHLPVIIISIGMLISNAYAAKSKKKATVSKDSKMNSLIENYLMQHPEVIIKAVQKYQAQQEFKQKASIKDYLVKNAKALFTSTLDGRLGSPKANTTVMIINDYQCGYCRKAMTALNKVMTANSNINIEVKHLPILGPDSVLAAKAAMLAEDLGKFKAADNLLLDMPKPMNKGNIIKAFSKIGISKDRLEAAWTDKKYEEAIQENYRVAQKLGVQGTPVIIVTNKDYSKVDFVENFLDEKGLQKTLNNH